MKLGSCNPERPSAPENLETSHRDGGLVRSIREVLELTVLSASPGVALFLLRVWQTKEKVSARLWTLKLAFRYSWISAKAPTSMSRVRNRGRKEGLSALFKEEAAILGIVEDRNGYKQQDASLQTPGPDRRRIVGVVEMHLGK